MHEIAHDGLLEHLVSIYYCSRGPTPLALARGRRFAPLPSGPSLGPQALRPKSFLSDNLFCAASR
jgi:hypothetical protein